ncbi:MAG TPA: hypothetical protein VM013_05110 [Dehalococcoidia bacterium]|nr:hypothetical protein [Dehalococcoidia bacterium]
MIVEHPMAWPVRKAGGGKLVTVQIRPGVGMKMHVEEARAKGLWPPPEPEEAVSASRDAAEKAVEEAPHDKMRRRGRNKTAQE